ncbi:MAG TPA: GspH/FimT family pseudopilin [Cellvibrionaceae bacterium]
MQRMRGFTIIELMVTIAVVGVLVALAAPSFRTMILNQQSEGLGENLVTAFQLARSEAVRRGGFVSVCPANADGTACANAWNNEGVLVIVDSATAPGAGSVVLDSQDDRLRHMDFNNDNAVVTRNGGPTFLRFDGRGMLANSDDPLQLTSHVTGCVGDRQRTLVVNRAGMISIDRSECPGS